MDALTGRQSRELEYHRDHFGNSELLKGAFSFDVLDRPERRWWNAYWAMYGALKNSDLAGKRVLVVGCGAGDDALRIAKLGAHVSAFDLSPEAIALASALAKREGLQIDFQVMTAERLRYAAGTFDAVVARDIMHHVDIAETMAELRTVAKPGAVFVVNEIYSHSITELIRRSWLVERVLYPAMRKLIYGPGKPYITADERKLTERDMQLITGPLSVGSTRYFNFLVTRVIPDRWDFTAKLDRIAMKAMGRVGKLFAGRVLLTGRLRK